MSNKRDSVSTESVVLLGWSRGRDRFRSAESLWRETPLESTSDYSHMLARELVWNLERIEGFSQGVQGDRAGQGRGPRCLLAGRIPLMCRGRWLLELSEPGAHGAPCSGIVTRGTYSKLPTPTPAACSRAATASALCMHSSLSLLSLSPPLSLSFSRRCGI